MSVSWTDDKDQIAREFTIILDNWNGQARRVIRGGVLVLAYRVGSDVWHEWFRGTVVSDVGEHDDQLAQKTIRVQDPMRVVGRSTGKFSFRAGRTATESIRDQLTKMKFPIGHLEDTKHRLPAVNYQGKLYDAFVTLLNKTFSQTGRRFVCEIHEGKFYLFSYRAPVFVWDFDLVTSRLRREVSIDDMIDKLVLRGRVTTSARRHQKKTSRATTAIASSNRLKLLRSGLITVDEEGSGSSNSQTKLNKEAKAKAAARAKPIETLEVDMPLDAMTLRRLQPVHFDEADPVTGAKGRYYVSSITATLDGTSAATNLVLSRRPEFYEPEQSNASPQSGGGSSSDVANKVYAEAERIDALKQLYFWGGGHGDGGRNGYDCSGGVSACLIAGGVLSSPLGTPGLNTWGQAGEGTEFTVWVKETGVPRQSHTFLEFHNQPNRWWEAGGIKGVPTGFRAQLNTQGFKPRHWSSGGVSL